MRTTECDWFSTTRADGVARSFREGELVLSTSHPPLSPHGMSRLVLRFSRQTELASYLADFTLGTDTAAGALALQKLAEEHHCGATLTVEPYKGLRKVQLCDEHSCHTLIFSLPHPLFMHN